MVSPTSRLAAPAPAQKASARRPTRSSPEIGTAPGGRQGFGFGGQYQKPAGCFRQPGLIHSNAPAGTSLAYHLQENDQSAVPAIEVRGVEVEAGYLPRFG